MLTEQGRVVGIEHDSLWVETQKTSTCASCSVRRGCGHKLLARTGGETLLTKALLSGDLVNEPWQVGDKAAISVHETAFLRASMLVFVVPVLMALCAVLGLDYIGGIDEQLIALGGLLGLVVGGLIVRHSAHTNSPDNAVKFQIVVSRRLID